jgi:hypothetical protein
MIEIPSPHVLPDGRHDDLGSLHAERDHLVVVVDHLDQILHVGYDVGHLADDHRHGYRNPGASQIVDLLHGCRFDHFDLLVVLDETVFDVRHFDLLNRNVRNRDHLFESHHVEVQICACRYAVQSSVSYEVFACEVVQLTILQIAS